jgi:hypothetical protein
MKTVELLKQIGQNVIVDRHPKVSECVYRRIEGRPSPLEYEKTKNNEEELIILCYDSSSKDDHHKVVLDTYKTIASRFEIPFVVINTKDTEIALDVISETIYQWIPR